MAESNKILTVSYGTFSCTLEGFDDAFTTMKAIAEYFRDLAADDRFFGAEPPTPDADMLARLASRTASRRVEARQDESGIVLRQETAALNAPTKAPTPEIEDAEEPEAETEEAEVAVEEAERAEEPAADPDAEPTITEEVIAEDEPEGEPVAEADPVAEETPEPEAAEPEAEAPEAPVARPVLAQNKSAVVTRRAKPEAARRVQPNRPRVQVSASRPTRVTPKTPEPAPHPDQNSVAAKLARIRGVVAKTGKTDVPNGYSEDQHAEGGDTNAVAEDLARAFETDLIEDTAESDAAATRAAIAAELAEREGRTPEAVEDDLDADDAMALANIAAEVDAEEEAFDEESFFAADEDDDANDDAEDDFAFNADDHGGEFEDLDEDLEEDLDEEPVAEAPAAPAARPVARVLKVKRRDFEAAVADGAIEEDDEPEVPDAIRRGESSLSPEDEAELQNELQALEQEIALGSDVEVAETTEETYAEDDDEDDLSFADDSDDEDDQDDDMSWDMDDTAEDDAEDETVAEDDTDDAAFDDDDAPAQEAVNPRRRLLRGADDDMDRIMKETDNQLGDSDSTRRRSAIAHLRAAVAATKAEKQAGGVAKDDEREVADVYRDDLAQVVRPRRPVSRGDTPSRRAEDRPAPLKLVAEQRVDLPTADAGPVRPRRVRMADLARGEKLPASDEAADAEAHARAAAANAASFNEFAERVGAASLPDLLEAAASYLAFVEGREQFTRPQLMVKARQALEDEFSREDGLRHFGRLLREGKLRKVAAGQFAVSDRINFRPEERAVG
ncbi:chemotaxis protein CheA [Pseudooceanicola onchidii]|uniref:chemotaxis protein CheA n=1 Tax=Pseudooceanicola onchidii TaxID=2562279 RepID=UPI0010AB0440|nr:chemotaxis protein CheA [Pseudooceanicola onchidii]